MTSQVMLSRAALVLVLVLVPRTSYAEVADKVPSWGGLTVFGAALAVFACIAWYFARKRVVVTVLLGAMGAVVGAAVISELLLSDITESVHRELGIAYLLYAGVIALILPLTAVVALSRRLLSREP